MSDLNTTVITPAPAAPQPQKTGTLGLVLAIIAAVTSVIPGLNFITWMLAVPALVLGIVALVKRNSPKGKALATVITAGSAWLLSILMVVVVAAAGIAGNADFQDGVESGMDSVQESPEAAKKPLSAEEKAAEDAAEAAKAEQDAADKAAKLVQEAADAAAKAAEEAAAAAAAEAARGTTSQQNATRTAQSYINMTGFSRAGLIEQLEYEGYPTADANWGADHASVDWNAEAAQSAKSYLDMTSFSRAGLIDQLIYEGFTPAEAEYGVSQTGL